MPTITQLAYVLAVHKTGHFGRAAAELGVSQPTLSAQIKKAEEELGVPLFDRQSKPIVLTGPGRRLIEPTREVVAAHERLLALASGRLAEPAGPYTLGVIPTLAPYVLPWFLETLAARHPAVALTVLERPTDEILVEIAGGRMDGAILATPLGEPSLRERVLFYDPFYVYARAGDPLLEAEAARVEDVDPEQLWLLEDGHCFRAQVINLCGIRGRALLGTVRFEGGSFETLRHLIDASGGCTLIPETYARTLPREVRLRSVRPFAERVPTREVSLVHHRQSWKAELHEAVGAAIDATRPLCFLQEPAEEEVLPIRVQG